MTEAERKKDTERILYYLPHKRDPALGDFEYYVLDSANRVLKVYITDIFCYTSKNGESVEEYAVYSCARRTRVWPHGSRWDDVFEGYRKGQLYDSAEDCKADTHDWYDSWERLREYQQKEYPDLYGQ